MNYLSLILGVRTSLLFYASVSRDVIDNEKKLNLWVVDS